VRYVELVFHIYFLESYEINVRFLIKRRRQNVAVAHLNSYS
jgi:hypothetical protein